MGWRTNRYGPVVTNPPAVGFAPAWKLRLPNVMRAQSMTAPARTWSPIAIGPCANRERRRRRLTAAATSTAVAASDVDRRFMAKSPQVGRNGYLLTPDTS